MLLNLFSMIYSVPSLALLALLIPVTGLGRKTAIAALVIYNQYLLLRNFLAGLDGVDRGAVEAAAGMGMTHLQLLVERKSEKQHDKTIPPPSEISPDGGGIVARFFRDRVHDLPDGPCSSRSRKSNAAVCRRSMASTQPRPNIVPVNSP